MGEVWEPREGRRRAGNSPGDIKPDKHPPKGREGREGARPQGVKGDRVHPASKEAQQAPLAK